MDLDPINKARSWLDIFFEEPIYREEVSTPTPNARRQAPGLL